MIRIINQQQRQPKKLQLSSSSLLVVVVVVVTLIQRIFLVSFLVHSNPITAHNPSESYKIYHQNPDPNPNHSNLLRPPQRIQHQQYGSKSRRRQYFNNNNQQQY